MKTRTVTVLAALTLSLCSVGAATASAGTLLSGYGGPGQGNQAILGSGLLNTPGGGQGGGSTGAAHGGKGTHGAPSHESAKGSATGGSAEAGARSAVVTQTASVSVPTLGLSGADLLYTLLAVAVLVMTAVFTRQLARRQG